MVIASLEMPNWVSYSVTASTGITYWKSLGLQKSCSSIDFGSGSGYSCQKFPTEQLCQQDRRFCSMWRSVGFLELLAVILHLVVIVSFLVVMAGGRAKREGGWKLLSGLLLAVSVFEFAGMAIVTYLFDHDDQFVVPGWYLDRSWYLNTVSAATAVLIGAGLAASAFLLPPEGGYQIVRDPGTA